MKRIGFNKVTALLLVFLCGTVLTTWSAGQDEATAAEEGVVELEYWVPLWNPLSTINTYDEKLCYQRIEDKFNVDLKFIHPPIEQEDEKFNLMMASGKELPDIIWSADMYSAGSNVNTGLGAIDAGIDDGVYLRLNDMLPEFAPNFHRLREENPDIARQTISDKGNIAAFPLVSHPVQGPWLGPVVRKDWLDDLGMEDPTTIDDWYEMLKGFKEEKGATAPFVLRAAGWVMRHGVIFSAWDITHGWINRNGEAVWCPMEDNYRECLTTLNKWYEEGLIDQDFPNRDSKSRRAMMMNGEAGSYPGAYGSDLEKVSILMADDPNFEVTAVPYPSLEEGQQVKFRQANFAARGQWNAITTDCEYPELAVQILDYGYGDEGILLFNCGIEGVSYEMVNGVPQFTDLIMNNPQGLDWSTALEKYKLHNGPYAQDWRIAEPEPSEVIAKAQEVWAYAGDEYVMPPIALNSEEAEIYTSVMTDVQTYCDEMMMKFIMGIEPISNFDQFVAQMKQMGIEKAVAVQQSALDRYLAK